MEELAKSVQQAQAAVLGVQDDLALLRAQLEKGGTAAPPDDSATTVNPYYVELQTSIHQKQEAAAMLLQSSAHLFFEQFGALEERAARLDNVHQKEKELHAAKRSMQRYFDAHAEELAEVQDTHEGVLRLELDRRHHLEEGAVALQLCQHRRQLAHRVMLAWMKRAMIHNLTREYMARQSTTRHTYQEVVCEALAQQRQVMSESRAFHTWRSRLHGRQLRRLEEAVVESEKRAQFFRQELATTQQALHDRLGAALELRQHINIEDSAKQAAKTMNAASSSNTAGEHEGEVQRLRTALEEMTLEFSERTGTYIRQQEHLEQFFWSKEQKMRETILGLQTDLSDEQQAHQTHMVQQRKLLEQAQVYWEAQHREWQAVMQRKEDFAHYSVLGLVERLRRRHRVLQDESAKLANEMHTLVPLSERCVQLQNQLATAQQLLQKTKDRSRVSEQRLRNESLVSEILKDRVVRSNNTALRAHYFAQWLQCSRSSTLQKATTEAYELKLALQKQRQQMLLQQQECSACYQSKVAHLEDNVEQLRRANVRLQSELDAAARVQQDRDRAYYDSEVKNGELSAALLREKIERSGLNEKWWCSRAEKVVLAELQARCMIETQECQWWSTLQQRERAALKVWTASLHYDAAQLTAVCEGWEAHCNGLEMKHHQVRRDSASHLACALERAILQSQTLVRWAAWRAWAQERRTVRTLEAQASDSRRELIERHGNELARLHARHDAALRRQQQELTLEKSQLQSIHQKRSEVQRREYAQEQSQLVEQHRQQLAELQVSHKAATDELEDLARELQSQMEHLGSVVVEYCADATFARWRLWAMQRRMQRDGRQRRGFLMRVQEWHVSAACAKDGALLGRERLFNDFAAQAAQEHHSSFHGLTQRCSQERELYEARLHKVELAKDGAEKEVAHLRDELRHTRSLYDEERHYCAEVQQSIVAERRDHRTALSLASRLSEWWGASQRTWFEQQRAVVLVFEDAVTEMLCDASIDALALRETYSDCVREHVATRTSLHRATAERTQLEEDHAQLMQRHEALQKSNTEALREISRLADTRSALEKNQGALQDELDSAKAKKQAAEDAHAALARAHDVMKAKVDEVQNAFAAYMKNHGVERVDAAAQAPLSPLPAVRSLADSSFFDEALEANVLDVEQQQPPKSACKARPAVAVDAIKHSNPATTSTVEHLPLILPSDFARRLCELETYTTSSAASLSEAAYEHLGRLLHVPFVLSTPSLSASSACKDNVASCSLATVHPSEAALMVCHVLETVRHAALRWAEVQVQRSAAQLALLDTRRAQSAEAQTQSWENTEGLLDEQRSRAGATQRDAQQEEAESPNDSSSLLSQSLQERLGALTARYAHVLNALFTGIARRPDTCSVSGVLVEVERRSAELLRRFEDEMLEVAQLKRLHDDTSIALQQCGGVPASSPIPNGHLSVMSPEPLHAQCAETPFLARVLGDSVAHPLSDMRETRSTPPSPAHSASSSSTPSIAHSTPEKQALRERVHLLERLLVEAKVQIAETSAMVDSATATPPSLQARVWAAQDAKDFAHLSLTEANFSTLYGASASTTHAIMTALRSCTGRLKEAPDEMAQQLQTACAVVEESVRQRYRAEAERREATLRSCNEALTAAAKQQAREKQRYEQLLDQQRVEAADAIEKHARDTQLMRQNYTSEIEELTDHLNLLEGELEHTRQATQSAVRDAVARQTELLTIEHEQALRLAEKKLTRLTAERALLEERLAAMERDCESRLQQERDAFARLQERLGEAEVANTNDWESKQSGIGDGMPGTSEVHYRWETYLSCSASLFMAHCADKAEWFTVCATVLLEQDREEWETEAMHLRERVASLMENAPSISPLSSKQCDTEVAAISWKDEVSTGVCVPYQQRGSPSNKAEQTILGDTLEETSSQALTLSPTPQRSMAKRISKEGVDAHSPTSPHHPRSRSNPVHAASTAAAAVPHNSGPAVREAFQCTSAGTSPTRCRCPSVGSLDVSQSLLRYSMMLSDQRTRNTERLERANALVAEVDDLLVRGVEVTRLTDTQGRR